MHFSKKGKGKGMSSIYYSVTIQFIYYLYWEKRTLSKIVGKVNFSKRKFEEIY